MRGRGAPLTAFTRDKVVLGVRDHFFKVGSTPCLALVIEYRLPPAPMPRGDDNARDGRPRTSELREQLSGAERELFDLLRAWRAGLAREEGLPAYAVLTNAQLVALARRRPRTPSALLEIAGLGRKTAQRYGTQILAILGEAPPASPPEAG